MKKLFLTFIFFVVITATTLVVLILMDAPKGSYLIAGVLYAILFGCFSSIHIRKQFPRKLKKEN